MGVYVGLREFPGYDRGEILAEAPLGILRKVTHDGVAYQTLAHREGGDSRDSEVEKRRFDEKNLLLNYKKIRRSYYFVFDDKTLIFDVPRVMKEDSDEFEKMRKDAGMAFDTQNWDNGYMT
jgi:hypothetical protein